MSFWLLPLTRILLVAVAALITGFFAGPAAAFAVLSVGLAAMVIVQLHYLDALQRWLRRPDETSIPDGFGAWGDVFSELYRTRRRDEKRRRDLAGGLERAERAAQALPDGVVMLNADQRIEWCNSAAERLLGIDRGRDRGRVLTHLVRYPGVSNYLKDASGGEPILVRTAEAPARSLSLQVIQFAELEKFVLVRDVTTFERTETIRRDFIANVSHELRTPLTIINGYLEHMKDGTLHGPVGERAVSVMHDQVRRMTRLVEDLLILSRLEAEGRPGYEEAVDVAELVEQLVEEGRTLSKGRHEITAGEVSPLRLHGNPEELRSAFTNLVSNAIRYTSEGGAITLRWDVGEDGATLSVSDTGIGIAAEHIPRLTERFYRVDRSRSRDTGGTGLGLAIVKHVLLRHGASLEIESELGRGSTFRCVFPASRLVTDTEHAAAGVH
jgi:two-component system phosphate regulon sensor histidine kinase PhoR